MAVGSLQYLTFVKSNDLASGEMIYLLDVLIRIRHGSWRQPTKSALISCTHREGH